jgi:hypothetical protein
VNTPREPGLDRLVMALTADGHPAELAGRDAALAAFRAASQSPRRAHRRNPLGLLPARLAAVVAAGAAALAGVTAAAYAQALPAPVQHIAYTVFAPLGVPNSQPQPAAPGHPQHTASASKPASAPGSTPQGAGCPCPATASATPSPTTAAHLTLTLSAARVHLPAYAVDVFTGQVTRRGHAAAGIRVRLFERAAGTTTWRPAASGKTGPHGGFRLLSPRLTTTSAFRVSGPGSSNSIKVRVTVGAGVRLKPVPGKVNYHLIVIASAARPGDTAILEELIAGNWTKVASKRLGAAYQASFPVAAKTAAAHTYRGEVVIAGFPVPGAAVWVPRAKHTTGATIIGGPSPSPSVSPTPTVTPTLTSMPSPTTTVTAQPTPTDSGRPAATGSEPPSATPAPTDPSPAPTVTPTGPADPAGSPPPASTSSGASQSARFV